MSHPNGPTSNEKNYKGSLPVTVKKTPGHSAGAVKTKPTHPGNKPHPVTPRMPA